MSKFILRVTPYALVLRSFDVSSTFSGGEDQPPDPGVECLESTSRADHSRKTCNGNDQTT